MSDPTSGVRRFKQSRESIVKEEIGAMQRLALEALRRNDRCGYSYWKKGHAQRSLVRPPEQKAVQLDLFEGFEKVSGR